MAALNCFATTEGGGARLAVSRRVAGLASVTAVRRNPPPALPLVVNGQSFDALSAAADALAVTKDGKKPSLNGWLYWKVKFPGESKWRSLNDMRRG